MKVKFTLYGFNVLAALAMLCLTLINSATASPTSLSDLDPIQRAHRLKPKPQQTTSFSLFRPSIQHGYARLTAYWTNEDYWTRRHLSATGLKLREGYCAVDPKRIPYGSVVTIPGMGKFLAVDTGTDVINRRAARKTATTYSQRNALVVDIFFLKKKEGRYFEAQPPKFVDISWAPPTSTNNEAIRDRLLFADANWSRLAVVGAF